MLLAIIEYWHNNMVWPWIAGIAALLLATAYFKPTALNPFNLLWFKFGMLLHSVVNPVVMGILFFAVVLPTGILLRAFGKDLLWLRRNPNSDTYWIARRPPGPAPETMKNQF